MSVETQNMKTGPDALGTAENESRTEKLKNGRPQHSLKRVRERKT
jgi:hypothetical protein